MMATHNLSKPLNVFTPQAHKPTILNLHPNNVTILSSSISGGNWRVLRQEMCLRDHLQPTETMGLSGPDPKAVAMKRPITRICMCRNERVPSWRSQKLGILRGDTGASEALEEADDAESEFKKILWPRVEFKDLEKCAWRMEMSGKEDAAVKELLWYICLCEGSHEIYEGRMLLVEMLIYQGDYGRARQTWERARRTLEEPRKDYRLEFYPAVIFVLLGEEDEAKTHWDAFNEMCEQGFGPRPPKEDGSEAPMAFSEFKDHVKVLGQMITGIRSMTHKEKK